MYGLSGAFTQINNSLSTYIATLVKKSALFLNQNYFASVKELLSILKQARNTNKMKLMIVSLCEFYLILKKTLLQRRLKTYLCRKWTDAPSCLCKKSIKLALQLIVFVPKSGMLLFVLICYRLKTY